MSEPTLTRRGFLGAVAGATAAPALIKPAAASQADPKAVSVAVNGKTQQFVAADTETLLEVVRDRLGLTAAKEACGHGACGACAVHVDGTPVASCLYPATSLGGKQVRTLEGLGDTLHPVQRAFWAEDALQCGYCTPGMVMESVAFFDRWRATRGAHEPTREEVADALGGHLCRCGAYDGIIKAVQGACAGRYDEDVPRGMRVDGEEKVRGKATYTVDVKLPGMLEARVLRASRGNGVISTLDISAAQAMSGVKAVQVLAPVGSTLRYAGQEVAAVAAVDRRTADAALAAIKLEVTWSAPALGLANTGPVVWPSHQGTFPNANEAPAFGNVAWTGNVRGPQSTSFGLDEGGAVRAVEGAPVRVREVYTTVQQSHTPLEPRACVADWGRERLTVYMSSQAVTSMAEEIAERWELKRDQVRVIAQHVGGGFGSKAVLDITTKIAIDLSKAAGAPVRHVLDRHEELAIGGYRPAQEITLEVGCDNAGKLQGLLMDARADSGVAIGAITGILARISYNHPKKRLRDYDITTHVAPGKPLRAPGGPPAYFALESTVDTVAHQLGLDPIDVRRGWDDNEIRHRLYDWASAHPAWKTRKNPGTGRFRRGIGVAAASWYHLVQPTTRVRVSVDSAGVAVDCAVQDMGQGSRTVLARAVSEVLGVDPHDIKVRIGDSDGPHGPLSGGSRTTTSLYSTAQDAATQLLAEVKEHVGGETIDWAKVLPTLPRMEATAKRKADIGGWFLPITLAEIAVGRALGHGIQLTEVEVDTWLGRVRATRMWGHYAVGRIVAPTLARSQIFGAMIQNLSYTLYEARAFDPKTARLTTANLEDYRIAGAGDIPTMEATFDEDSREKIRGQVMGLSELAACPVAASIGNAVFDATGWRPTTLPLRVDRVLTGLV